MRALPKPLRWVLFLPLGIAGSLLAVGLLDAVFDAIGLPRTLAFTARAAASLFVYGFTFVLFPALLSPRPWPVGVVMSGVGVLVSLAPIVSALMVPYQRYRLLNGGAGTAAAWFAASLLGGLLALLVLWRREKAPGA